MEPTSRCFVRSVRKGTPLLLICALFTLPCGSPSLAADATFVQAIGGLPTSLDPGKSNRIHDDQVMWFLYDALLQYSQDGKTLLPALAERWAQSADGLTTTFY